MPPAYDTETERAALARGAMPRLDPHELRGFERISVAVCDWINTRPQVKRLVQFFVRHVSATWVYGVTRNLVELHGLQHVRDLAPPRGVILVSNHRSFFDMYVASAVLYRHARFMERLYFPVRTNTFYTHPAGLLINLAVSGCAMWPPVFRDERRYRLNPIGIAQMVHAVNQPGAVLGIHPEGTRGKGPDPYELLPARPGVGHLVKACHPETRIVPFFINGLSNNLFREVRRNFRPPGRRGPPIRITFGAPIRAADLDREAPALDLAQGLLETIRRLGEEDRRRSGGVHPELPPPTGAPGSG